MLGHGELVRPSGIGGAREVEHTANAAGQMLDPGQADGDAGAAHSPPIAAKGTMSK